MHYFTYYKKRVAEYIAKMAEAMTPKTSYTWPANTTSISGEWIRNTVKTARDLGFRAEVTEEEGSIVLRLLPAFPKSYNYL